MKIIKYLTGRAELKKQLLFKNIICSILILTGILFNVLNIFNVGIFKELTGNGEHIYSCVANSYIVIGFVRIIRNRRILANETLLKKYEIAINDERNINIQRRALSASVFAYTWLGFIIGLIAVPFSDVVACTIFYSICVLLIFYCVMAYIFNKTM